MNRTALVAWVLAAIVTGGACTKSSRSSKGSTSSAAATDSSVHPDGSTSLGQQTRLGEASSAATTTATPIDSGAGSTVATLAPSADAAGSSPPATTRDAKPRVRFEEQSKYTRVFVVDEGNERHLRFGAADEATQSFISLDDPKAVPMQYIRLVFVGLAYTPERERALMIGLGGGTFTTLLRRHFPDMWIDVAEIDPVVVKAAKQFFGVQEDERYRIHLVDGAEFVASTPHRYDIVLLDAYDGDDIPEHLGRAEFFRAVAEKTTEQGIVVLNLAVPATTERLLERRFRATFAEVSCARTRWRALILYGRRNPGLLSPSELRHTARMLAEETSPSFDVVAEAAKVRGHCPLPRRQRRE